MEWSGFIGICRDKGEDMGVLGGWSPTPPISFLTTAIPREAWFDCINYLDESVMIGLTIGNE
jgi:hypothetical protein